LSRVYHEVQTDSPPCTSAAALSGQLATVLCAQHAADDAETRPGVDGGDAEPGGGGQREYAECHGAGQRDGIKETDGDASGGGGEGAAPSSAAPAAAPPPPAPSRTLAEQEAEFRKRQAEREKAAQKEEQDEAQANARAAACTQAKGYLELIQSGARLMRPDAEGNRNFMDEEQRAAEIQKAQDGIAKNCS